MVVYHRFRWYATLENETLAETFPKFLSVWRVIDTDRIEIHQSQPLAWQSNLLYVMLARISIRHVDNTKDWRKFWNGGNRQRYAVYKYTLSQVHHITAIRSNTPIRHCSKFFPLKLNNPSVTSDVSSFQAKWLPRLTSQTNSAHSLVTWRWTTVARILRNLKTHRNSRKNRTTIMFSPMWSEQKGLFWRLRKNFGVRGTLTNMSTFMLLLGVLSFRYNCNVIVISFSFWQKSPSTSSSVLHVYLTIILPHAQKKMMAATFSNNTVYSVLETFVTTRLGYI